MRTLADTEARVIDIIEKTIPVVPADTIRPEQDLRDELALDSNMLMSIAFRLEKEFEVDITVYADELAKLRTVGDVAKFFYDIAPG